MLGSSILPGLAFSAIEDATLLIGCKPEQGWAPEQSISEQATRVHMQCQAKLLCILLLVVVHAAGMSIGLWPGGSEKGEQGSSSWQRLHR